MNEEIATGANVIAAAALLVSLYGAFLARRSSRSSDTSAEAARDSAATARQAVELAKLESHQARSPRFEFRVFEGERGQASLVLLGPQDLAKVAMEIISLDPAEGADLSLTGKKGDYGASASLESVAIGENNKLFVYANPDLMLLRLTCTNSNDETWTVAVGASRLKNPYAKPD